MADNVISFKDAVIELQRLNRAASEQTNNAKESLKTQRMIVAVDAAGNKKLIEEEEAVDKHIVEETKKTSENLKDSHKTLKEIKSVLTSISKTLEKSLSTGQTLSGVGAQSVGVQQGTELTEDQQEANKAQDDANKDQHVLLNKLVEGITGLKEVTDKGLAKMIETYKAGSGEGGGILGGLKSLFEGGKSLASGGLKSAGGRLAGMARGGLNMISKAGPLAGAAGIGLAGFNVVNDVMGNIDKSNEIEENVKSGALTRNQGNVLQGESLGDTAGTTAGAAIGGIAGSALGPLGTAAGMWLGSKVGGWVGGKAGKYGVKAYQGIKSMLGYGETEKQEQAKMSPEQKLMNQYTSGEIDADEYNKRMKLQNEGGSAPPAETPVAAQADVGKVGQGPTQITPPGVSPVSNIVATPTQVPSEAGVVGKSGGWGAGIKSWFGGTRLGKAWAERGVGVGYNGVGSTSPEMLVKSKDSLKESDINGVSSRQINEGITTEKSALGSTWLGKLMSSKGTETENFVSETSKAATGTDGSASQFLGKRENGGWFGADKYSIGDKVVDKATYMKAKDIAAAGGDASQISGLLDDFEKNKTVGRGGNRLYDTTNKTRSVVPVDNKTGDNIHTKSIAAEDAKEDATKPAGGNAVVNAPTVVNNTTNSTSTMRSPFKNEESSVNRYMRTRYGAY